MTSRESTDESRVPLNNGEHSDAEAQAPPAKHDAFTLAPPNVNDLQEQQHRAVKDWAWKTKIVIFFQTVAAICWLFASFILSSMSGVAMIIFGWYAVFALKREPVFVYLVLNLLNFVKNIGVLALQYVETPATIILVIADMAVLMPIGMYCGYYLYQSLSANVFMQ